jgi:hypothetical protein
LFRALRQSSHHEIWFRIVCQESWCSCWITAGFSQLNPLEYNTFSNESLKSCSFCVCKGLRIFSATHYVHEIMILLNDALEYIRLLYIFSTQLWQSVHQNSNSLVLWTRLHVVYANSKMRPLILLSLWSSQSLLLN